MLLPRHAPSSPGHEARPESPPSVSPPSVPGRPGPGLPVPPVGQPSRGSGSDRRSRQQQQTIDDPELRAELAEALAARPFEFLFHAARTLSVVGGECPALVQELEVTGYCEGLAMAAALCWLATGDAPNGHDERLPSWLANLDQARLVDASRRRDGFDHSMSNCLIEVELYDGSVGTLHARIDHALDGALTNAFVVDDPLVSIRQLFRVADRWRLEPADGRLEPRPFRRIKPATAQRAVAGALVSAEGVDQPLDLNRPWPGNRSLVAFLVNNPDLVGP